MSIQVFYGFFLLVLWQTAPAFSQNSNVSTSEHLVLFDALLTQQENAEAITALRSACRASSEVKDTLLKEQITRRMELLDSVKLPSDTIQFSLYFEWAQILRTIYQDYSECQRMLQRAQQYIGKGKSDMLLVVDLNNERILTYGAAGQWEDAKSLLIDQIQFCEKNSLMNKLAEQYHNLGFVKKRLMEDGMGELSMAMSVFKKYNPSDVNGHSYYNTMGRTHLFNSDFDIAFRIYSEYAGWVEKYGYTMPPYAAVGWFHAALEVGPDSEAAEIEQKLLANLKQWSDHHRHMFFFSMSDALLQSYPYRAKEYAMRGLQETNGIYSTRQEYILGQASFSLGEYQFALDQMQKFLSLNYSDYDPTNVYSNPNADLIKNYKHQNVFQIKGRALWKLGCEHDNIDMIYCGHNCLLVGDSILQDYRSQLSRSDRKIWNQYQYDLAASGARIADELYRRTGDEKWLGEIFKWSERFKSRARLDKSSREALIELLDLPAHIVSREQELLQTREQYRTALKDPDSSLDSLEIVRGELAAMNKDFVEFNMKLRRDFPKYVDLQVRSEHVSITDVQELLKPDQGLISYFLGDSALYAFLITPQDIHSVVLDKDRPQLEIDIHNLQQSLYERSQSFYTTSNTFYQHWLEPILDSAPPSELIIVPAGNLALIPFDLLISDLESRRFLLEDVTICQYPSASLYFREQREKVSTNQMLAMTPSFSTKEEEESSALSQQASFAPLPGAVQELDHLADHFSGLFLTGDQASESMLKQRAHDYNIIHLASHTVADSEDENQQGILLTADGENDGLLEMDEIYQMDVQAELIVLSACNSGIGQIETGEGVASLADAFHFAGCSNMLKSMWAVRDATTAPVINSFYSFLQEGLSLPEALRHAKIDFLKNANPKFSHPYYWGGFVLMGHHDSLAQVQEKSKYITKIGIPFFFILFMLAIIRHLRLT